jgi:WD40 repeat protein
VQHRQEINLSSSIRNAIQESFAFAGPDRIVAVDPYSAHKSPVLRFPTGERIGELPLSNTTHVSSASHGDYVMLWPLKEKPLGIMDLNKRELFASFQHDAGDIYDGIILHERKDGEIALTDFAAKKTVASVQLQQSRLGRTIALTVSNDLDWLALSTRTRGAVWDLQHNIRVQHVRGFYGGWFGEDHSLYADFPKDREQERAIVRLDPYGNLRVVAPVDKKMTVQWGSYLVREECAKDSGFVRKDCTITVQDFSGKNTIWSRRFPREAPVLNWNMQSGTVLLHWPLLESAAHDELQQFSELKAKAEKDDFLFEQLDFHKDAVTGKLLVKTNRGSFRPEYAVSSGDWLLLGVSGDRVLTFSFSSGQEKGHVFGADPVVSATAGRFAVSTSTGGVDLYDLDGTQLRRQFKFPTSIAYKQFSPDGKRLFVLTYNQTAYVLDLTVPEITAASSQP